MWCGFMIDERKRRERRKVWRCRIANEEIKHRINARVTHSITLRSKPAATRFAGVQEAQRVLEKQSLNNKSNNY